MGSEAIVRIDTFRHPSQPHLVHTVLHGADGATGLGETFWAGAAVDAYIHESLAPRILELDTGAPLRLREECRKNLYGSPRSAGPVSVESAAASAIDIAAWDMEARRRGVSLATLVSRGEVRAQAETYNTCCDPDHTWVPRGQGSHWDFTASIESPRRLAEELVAAGYRLMKVFPFEQGRSIDESVRLVTETASVEGMSVAVDLYDQFPPDQAREVVEALDRLGLAWIEDPFVPIQWSEFEEFARSLHTPLCSGETLAGRAAYQRLARESGLRLIHCDAGWAGGVSGALEAAEAAAENHLPITFHGCTGPVTWAVSVHLACALENAAHVESVRTLVHGAYADIAAGVPDVVRARVSPRGPGHGCSLTPSYLSACALRSSGAERKASPRPLPPAGSGPTPIP